MNPYDYYHGQPRIDQDSELVIQNGYIGQYYMTKIARYMAPPEQSRL